VKKVEVLETVVVENLAMIASGASSKMVNYTKGEITNIENKGEEVPCT